MQPVPADPRNLPLPALDTGDPAAQAVSSAIAQPEPDKRVAALRLVVQQHHRSREGRLRLAASLAETRAYPESDELLRKLGEEDPWDWRVLWFQAHTLLAQGQPAEARKLFDQVYFDLPGEITPKLALGLAAELAGDLPVAMKMYDLVSRTDPGYVSAVFGLARCFERDGDRKAAVAALDRIPSSSALWLRARVQAAMILVRDKPGKPRLEDLVSASQLAQTLTLSGLNKVTLSSRILNAAVLQVQARAIEANPSASICGTPVREDRLRRSLEASLREMARYAAPAERIRLVDEANQVRPRTLI
jgi:serine/threonine-protein kinase PknG